jgi:hypothetical protein
MQRITQIQLNNFKFFPASKPIKIDGKNILMYGENGSGKSSLYWALYTLLECANKPNPLDIQKYFITNNPASLVNIYAPVNAQFIADSFVKVTLTNGQEFQISNVATAINADQDAKISNYVSDFINYRLLQRTHNVNHSSAIDLFPLFEDAVINYLQFPPVNWIYPGAPAQVQVINGGEIWNIIKKGPAKTYSRKNGNNDSYPLKTRHRAAYNDFAYVVDGFYNGLNGIMGRINPLANNILQNELQYNISFRLVLEKLEDFSTSENQYHAPKYKINLLIDDYNGKGPVVVKPQSFLNEARLSAISLSIRLAILGLRLPDSLIKILLLDDLLVSLDMTNRDKVTKLFLNEYAWWQDATAGNQDKGHQTFILTHDRSYFTFVKHEIENLPPDKKDKWKLIEVYADDPDPAIAGDFEKPRIFDYENELRTAFRHYRNHDYPSAANYLRKFSENILGSFLPEYCRKDANKEDKSNAKIQLNSIIENGIAFWELFGINAVHYKELRKYVAILLNPLSHADVGVERYKQEIKEVDAVVREIVTFHTQASYKSIASGGEIIQLRIPQPGTTDLFVAEYVLKTSLYHSIFNGAAYFSTFKGKAIRSFELSGTGVVSNEHKVNGNDKEMHINYTEFCALPPINVATVGDWHKFLFNANNIQVITFI